MPQLIKEWIVTVDRPSHGNDLDVLRYRVWTDDVDGAFHARHAARTACIAEKGSGAVYESIYVNPAGDPALGNLEPNRPDLHLDASGNLLDDDLQRALAALPALAEGDSNDDEIDGLRDALDIALGMLGRRRV